jgi:hypothetical protein
MSIDAIYDALIEHGRKVPLPCAWERHTRKGPQLVELPRNWERTIEKLRPQFAEDDLSAAGVLDQFALGEYDLPGRQVLPIYGEPEQAPGQLLDDCFCLPKAKPTHLALFDDYRFRMLLQSTVMGLAIASDLSDATILLHLDIPAIPVDRLAEIDAQGLQTFERTVSQIRGGRRAVDTTPLVFVGCSLTLGDWSLSGATVRAAEHFCHLQQHLHIGPRLNLWVPSGQVREALRTVLHYGSAEDLQRELMRSMERNAMPLPSEAATRLFHILHGTEPIWNITSAMRDWLGAHRLDRLSRQPVMQRLERERNAALIEPLLELADQTEDPIERNLLVMLSNTFRQLHDLAARLCYLLAVRENESFERAQIPETSLSQQQMLTNQALSLLRALEARRASRKESYDD